MSPWAKITEAILQLNQKLFYNGYVMYVGHEMLLKQSKDVTKRTKA